jgi:hypothetical protein
MPLSLRRRLKPGAEVVAALPTGTCRHRHARHTIRGVVDRHGGLTFYSPAMRGELRIPLRDLGRAGYTIRRSDPL